MTKTGWFNGFKKPVRNGVYERDHPTWGKSYSNWHNGVWFYPAYTVIEALNNITKGCSDVQHCPWRGLASNPNVKT